ncbi:hypothetical protein HC891_21930 [Candidatus Gracilibacteria bacterium]|nr:hypothetical protein [Candidatus Gracilibacteria bacterium]
MNKTTIKSGDTDADRFLIVERAKLASANAKSGDAAPVSGGSSACITSSMPVTRPLRAQIG